MAAGGVWRIDDVEVPTPVTEWQANVIGPRLNGLPLLNSYYTHAWSWPTNALEACYVEALIDKFYAQDATGQLSYLETDSHDADLSLERWGTSVYTDFWVLSMFPLRRGLPAYDGFSVTFEVYVLSEV